MATFGPIIFLESAADAIGWAHWNAKLYLLMALPDTITFLGRSANAIGWAYHICVCNSQWPCHSTLVFWELLLVHQVGP